MKNLVLKGLAAAGLFLLIGCASTYKEINPSTIKFSLNDTQEGIGLSYRHDILMDIGNSDYAKKEYKSGIKLVAVKLTNNTDSVLNIRRDLEFFSGPNPVTLMDPKTVMPLLHQMTPAYLFYLVLTPLKLNVSRGTLSDSYSIGYYLGPTIAFGNMFIANKSNNAIDKELSDNNIIDRDLKQGETIYGIIAFRDKAYNPVSVRKIKK